MDALLRTLGPAGLHRFQILEAEAVRVVAERLYSSSDSVYAKFGTGGRVACREDLAFHLEFLRSALASGLSAPLVDYLRRFAGVLAARAMPGEHLALSLDWLAEFFVAHMDAADVAIVESALHAARNRFVTAEDAPMTPPQLSEASTEAVAFREALLASNQREALAIVNSLMDSGHTLIDIELQVIQVAMYQIGEQWQANQITVAQEHIATAIVQSVMTAALLRSTPSAPVNKSVLLACVAGNHHTIGLRMVADSFQLAGWEIQYLCADVPTEALVHQIGKWSPNLVGLSLSFAEQLPAVRDVISQLSARFGAARPPVMICGLAINRLEAPADLVGADAYGVDAGTAVGTANQLVRG